MNNFKYEIYNIHEVTYEDDDQLHIHADCFLFLWDISAHENFKLLWDNGFKPTKIVVINTPDKRDWELIEWKEKQSEL